MRPSCQGSRTAASTGTPWHSACASSCCCCREQDPFIQPTCTAQPRHPGTQRQCPQGRSHALRCPRQPKHPELPGQNQCRREPGAASLQSPNLDLGGRATSSKALYERTGPAVRAHGDADLEEKRWHREGAMPASMGGSKQRQGCQGELHLRPPQPCSDAHPAHGS